MNPELADLSRTLFSPVALGLFLVAMVGYLYAMAVTRVAVAAPSSADGSGSAVGAAPASSGRTALRIATVAAVLGAIVLAAHIVVRGMAAGRMPLGNMFEFSTIMALTIVVSGLVVFQWRLDRPEVMGFLLLGTVLTMGAALLVYSEPGPLMPILSTAWRAIHVSAIVFAAGLFTVSFVFASLYLLRDTAERHLQSSLPGGSVGAARAVDLGDVDDGLGTVPQRQSPDDDLGILDAADIDGLEHEVNADHRSRMRAAINPWRLAAGTFAGTSAVAWVFWVTDGPARFLSVTVTMVAASLVARWFVPYLPSAATLDAMAYRTIAFAFPIWTFAVISGAIWAEQSWGRYWGWDPKETSAFLTWVAYAGYLHARATRGMKGRNAGWLAILAFAVLMFTYFGVNLVVTGLHSYAGPI